MDEVESTDLTMNPVQPAEQRDREAMPVDTEQPPRMPFSVVGVGASAGGLQAFIDFFKAMPSDSGMAFVLVQHLPPDRESMISEIISRHTAMKVEQVRNGMPVEPNCVYVIRPGHTLTIKGGRLHLGENVDKPRHTRPVDDFFKSLAEEQRERAICIIMSGMGSNGSAGAQAIKAVGGICIAQDPDTAEYPSMPRNLIDAGYSDYVLPVGEMPELLVGYSRHPYAVDRANVEGQLVIEAQHLREILAILRTRTRRDFTGYKKQTLMRRIQRRMGLNRVTEIAQYARILRQSPIEVTGLGDDLLIHVTGFFRDPQAWEALRERVIVPLIDARQPHEPIRCWVAACSSGEEAYSLAILLVEECERSDKLLDIKVFATDTAERTLANARNGVFPGGIEADISPDRLARFFEREGEVYRVRQDLRERVVFAPQNVLTDPPFSRLDIVTCRNLLIYLEPDVQHRVMEMMHFGLRPGGVLFLGTSETASSDRPMFEVIDKKARIYRRIGPTHHGMLNFELTQGTSEALEGFRAPRRAANPVASLAQLTTRALVTHHIPVAVTVDRNFRIVYFQGASGAYLGQPSGEPTQELIALAKEPVRSAVRVALQRAMKENSVQSVTGGWVTNAVGKRRRVIVTASPLVDGPEPDLFVVSFQERDDPEPAPAADATGGSRAAGSRVEPDELQRLRDELQSTIEELQASTEESKAAAEEAMSVNEELQSTNEELETSKEEMQSLNEELSTVNAQLHAKMDELQKTSGDLRSLLSSTDIAVIFLDPQFRIRRYTPAARTMLELIGSDVGRPLSDLARKFTDPDLLDDAQAVLDRLVPVEREVRGHDGRWYQRRVLAYRTADDRIEGVVITFVDISDRKRAELVMAEVGASNAGELRAMGSLNVVSNYLIGAKNLHAVLDEILAAACDLHGTDQGIVYLYSAVPQELTSAVHRGLPASLLEQWGAIDLSAADDPATKAFNARAAVVVEDIANIDQPAGFREAGTGAGVRALVHIPMITRGGELVGLLSLYFAQPHQPDDRGMRITELLVRQGADTIERIRIEEELGRLLKSEQHARRALDDAAEMKDQFLASLSHELRTPLSAILLWGKVLAGAQSSDKEMADGVSAIIRSAESQARLIDDLLDTSSIALGKLRLQWAEMDVEAVMRSVVEQSTPAARGKGLRIETEFNADVGTVLADSGRIRQVVWNLLTNAIKFTPNGGVVTVTLARVAGDVIITVSDTGSGIDPAFIPYVFDRFRQYDASITRKHGGLGLGLAICKQLVELHGGTIRAESNGIGRGSRFTVTMPFPALHRSITGNGDVASRRVPKPLRGTSILLVEDEPATLEVLVRVLEEAGAEVATETTGGEALSAYRQHQPQIVLSDVGLPDFDGYTLLGQIRAFEKRNKLPAVLAVALTAYARAEDRIKAANAGYQLHLPKPIDADHLIAALANVAAGN